MTQQQTEQKTCDEKPETNDGDILRRNNRGCKAKDFYNWLEQPLDDMDSPLAVQQYIQQLIRKDPSNIDEILRLPEGQDLGAWKIEHLRLFCMQLNRLATRLQQCCQPETCNQMTATEQWIFLCAAHKQPRECPAIDYTRHTLDGAASLLNSNKYFPSRVTIKESSVAKLGSVCRRIYRIFSHAYYHHFQVFDEFEKESHLCKRFSQFVTIYDLMSKDSLIVPSDGSKPEIDSAIASQAPDTQLDTTVNVIAGSQADLAGDTTKKETPKNDDESQAIAAHLKADAKTKGLEGNGSPMAAASTAWSQSQISTNTIIKGSSTSVSLSNAKCNAEDNVAKQQDGDAVFTGPTSNSPARATASAKSGVESEA